MLSVIRTANNASRLLRVPAIRSVGTSTEFDGLSFRLSEEQQAFQELARKFAREEMIPKSAE